jgi:hypothetical protein
MTNTEVIQQIQEMLVGYVPSERERIGIETENQGPSGLLVSILRERAAGGRY